MTTDLQRTAVRQAQLRGVPYVLRSGREVVLLLGYSIDYVRNRFEHNSQHRVLSSSGLAAAVAARALTDLQAFPEHAHRILDVSTLYAEAALRHARRRRGLALP